MSMDISGRLQQLEDLVAEAKSMPLSSSALVNREEVQELLAAIRESLPEEIKQARWVVKDREELLGKARRDAEGLIQKALGEQGRLAAKEEVVKRSKREAKKILEDAQEQARKIKLEAEDYVDAKLASFEVILGRIQEEVARTMEEVAATQERLAKTSQQVGRGRQRLRGGTIVEEGLSAEEAQEAEERA